MKINRSLADASKQIERQTTQINKLNQDLQSLQKQVGVGQRQTEIVNEIRSQSTKFKNRYLKCTKASRRDLILCHKNQAKEELGDIRVRAKSNGNIN